MFVSRSQSSSRAAAAASGAASPGACCCCCWCSCCCCCCVCAASSTSAFWRRVARRSCESGMFCRVCVCCCCGVLDVSMPPPPSHRATQQHTAHLVALPEPPPRDRALRLGQLFPVGDAAQRAVLADLVLFLIEARRESFGSQGGGGCAHRQARLAPSRAQQNKRAPQAHLCPGRAPPKTASRLRCV